MDINILRIAATVVSFIAFIAIVVWVWKNRHSQDFDEAKVLPFNEE